MLNPALHLKARNRLNPASLTQPEIENPKIVKTPDVILKTD